MLRDEDISVVLVDEDDNVVGFGDKLDVHRLGILHRAFSVFVYDQAGKLLLQRRAIDKYHAGGKWANSVCGHPFAGEANDEAAERRLKEELGLSLSNVKPVTKIYYKKELNMGMIEHEYVHVFEAEYQDEQIRPDPMEVSEIKWMHPTEILREVEENDEPYAAWFAHYMREFYEQLFGHRNN